MRAIYKYGKDASFTSLRPIHRGQLKKISKLAVRLDERRDIPASSGNMSLNVGNGEFLISRSGIHKRLLNPSEFVRCFYSGFPVTQTSPKPSDETFLHALIYRNMENAKAVVHFHSGCFEKARVPLVKLREHELLKALGKQGHEEPVYFPVYKNSQDMKGLAETIEVDLFDDRESETTLGPVLGFFLEDHGVYIVGDSVEQVSNRLEALVHLMTFCYE